MTSPNCNSFENIASTYVRVRSSNSNHHIFKHHLWQMFFRHATMNLSADLAVLEAMCGAADGMIILREQGLTARHYHAFDLSKTMVEAARLRFLSGHKNEQHNTSFSIYIADVLKTSTIAQYDCIFLIGGLHHVYYHAAEAVANLYLLLKPGGYLVSFEPTHSTLFTSIVRSYIYSTNSFFDNDVEAGFALSKYNKLFADANFQPIYQVYPGLLLYCLFYNPDAFGSLPSIFSSIIPILFRLESRLYRTKIAQLFSFATLTCFQKAY